ncbi:glyoxalase [Nonomuraea aridisoli]|uniref:Glyoxalase n=1 Tax=Nonomuraea aridisoli TaxID=2070368 RepID=A0A2W2EHE3_9ACTN|nr:glyoxalase [Nonomuraea aridisoli]
MWPCLSYRDARAAIRFLADAFGFVERACYTEGDAVAHAELAWPSGAGAIMLGSADESNDLDRPTGSALLYVVTDDPDALLARATAAGAEVVRDLKDEDYGNRTFTVRDPEGNLWSFGTYPGS